MLHALESLEIIALHFSYGRHSVLTDVNLRLANSTALHLAGPNGAGKSTLLRVLAGVLPLDNGAIVLNRSKHMTASPAVSTFFAYLGAESNGLFYEFSAMDNLKFWTGLRGKSYTEAELRLALAEWGLGGLLVSSGLQVGKFSTGMKRRLGLAHVSLSGAACWLLDEPFNGLDSSGCKRFHDVLKTHLQAGGMATIAAHDTEPIADLISVSCGLKPGATCR